MTHVIKIYSENKFGEVEWTEAIERDTKLGATRKANAIIRSCGIDPKTARIYKMAIGKRYETWTLGR